MMSTPFCNASMCKRFSWRLALAFCFLSPVNSFADSLSDISEDTDLISSELSLFRSRNSQQLSSIDNSATNILRRLIDIQRAVEPMRDYNGNFVLNVTGLSHSDNLLYNSWRSMNALTNFLVWLQGVDTSPMNVRPFWQNLTPGGTQSYLSQGNNWDSLQNFLGYTLGTLVYGSTGSSLVNGNPGVIAWENSFVPSSAPSSQRGVRSGYGYFSVWLAEAMRRQIFNTTNLVTADWHSLNGSTNPVQAVQASVDQSEHDRSISNEVASVESDLNDLFSVDEPDNPSGYDNTDDFSDVVSSLGDDDDSLEWGDTIQLASSSKIRSIASEVGVNYTGPSAEISLSSFAGGVLRTDLIAPVGSLMVSVWHWIRSLAIFWVVVGWYNRVRALLLMTNPEPSSSGPFRDAGGIW